MNITRPVAAVATALATALVPAQASDFAGFSAGINGNFVSTSAEVHNGGFTGSIGDTDSIVSLQAGYGFDLGRRYWLGVDLSYSLGYLRGGSHGTTEFKAMDVHFVSVQPGYMLSDDSLVYAMISYVGMRGEAAVPGIPVASESQGFRGGGYGVGTRILWKNRLYLQMEVIQVEYNELRTLGVTYNPSSTYAIVGLGYRF